MKVIILADEIGEKLWPVTSEKVPMSYLPVFSDLTLLDHTIIRYLNICESPEDLYVVILEDSYPTLVALKTITQLELVEENIIKIPNRKSDLLSTMLVLSLLKLRGVEEDEQIIVTPANSFFWPEEGFLFHLANILDEQHKLETDLLALGLEPAGPIPSISYLEGIKDKGEIIGHSLPIIKEDFDFDTVKMPVKDTKLSVDPEFAEKAYKEVWFVLLGTYFGSLNKWYESIDMCGDKDLKKLETLITKSYKNKKVPLTGIDGHTSYDFSKVYKSLENSEAITLEQMASILAKKSSLSTVIPSKMIWFPIDSWVTIKHLLHDSGLFATALLGNTHLVESDRNLVFKSPEKEIALFGIEDLIIIDVGEKLLIGTPGALYEYL